MEQVYWYCLAYAANLHGALVHAACLMSTHCHEVITDVRGEYPRFLQTFHRHLALCTKAYRGWPEAVRRLRAFKAQYARALRAWTGGDQTACFPQGTWWMRVCHGARCGPGP